MKAGWKTVKLGEACKIVNGATPSTSVEANWGGPHCWITPAEMGGLSDPYVSKTRRTLTDAGLADCSASLLPTGSVILSSRAPIGHVIINTVPMATNQGCKSMIPRSDLDAKFLFYFIKANVPLLESLGTGATFKELSGGKLASVEIPLPPLAEQKRIVALLDEAFAGIDQATAKAQACIQSLGTLVVSEFQSLVDEKGFERKPLPELASHTLGKMLDKKKNTGTPRPYLRNVNVRWFEFDLSDIHEMPIRDEEAARCQARKGDVLMCEGGYPGRCAIWRSDEPMFFQKALHRIRFNEKWMAEWFVNYMHSLDSSGKISEFFTGTGIQHLTGETLSKLEIPAPPKSEIEAYVRKISAIRDETNDLAANERAKLDALSELKTSLLAQAFAGDLAV